MPRKANWHVIEPGQHHAHLKGSIYCTGDHESRTYKTIWLCVLSDGREHRVAGARAAKAWVEAHGVAKKAKGMPGMESGVSPRGNRW